MARLKLQLLGPVTAYLQDETPVEFAYDKVRALLAYLAVEHDRAHARGRLASLLWPETSESAARHSLSQALSSLRQSLGDRANDPPLVVTRRDGVQLDLTAGVQVDLLEWRRLIEHVEQHQHTDLASCPECIRYLEHAVHLARGPFLDGFSLAECEEFEDWQRAVQQMTERSLDRVLRELVNALERSGAPERARQYAERLVGLDPWDESSQRALIRLLAQSGHRAAAVRQYERCRQMLRRELDVAPEDETLELIERIRAGLEGPTTFERPSPSPRPAPPAFPTPATLFVGRETEVESITGLIETGESRLITLVGSGGIGKTRLALEVARARQEAFTDGVFFVPLAGLASPQLLASTILDAMPAHVDPQADSHQQLLAYLQTRNALLVLDNFEHLLEGSVLLQEILETAPGVQILATSRERLSLSGEWVYEVQGLSLPRDDDDTSIATSGAARLFMLCARKHKASFLPRREDAPAVVRICHLTGGMPLALELAAAWIPVLSPEEIADEIERSLDFLHATLRDLPERHRSIRAVLDRSWENLTEVEQRSFRRLSVFRGGFTRAAASYVSGASLPILSALVGKSFLLRDQQGRYQIHELVRQYGESLLTIKDGEADIVNSRHREYYIGFLAIRESQLEGWGQETALGEIAQEIENIRAAWHSSIQTGDYRGLSRAAHSLWLFYETTGRYREGASTMEAAARAIDAIDDVPDEQAADYQLARARLRSRHAAIAFRLSGPGRFHDVTEETIPIARALDDPAELGIQLNYLATSQHVLGNWDAEERALVESIEQFERADRPWGIAYSKNDLGHLRALRGNYLEARSLHQEALQILEELGDRRGVAFALRNLGLVASRLGDTELALALLRRSVDVRRAIGNQWGIAESLNQIGAILRDSGQTEVAIEHFREALQIAREIRAMQLAGEILGAYWPLLSGERDWSSMASRVEPLIQRAAGEDHTPGRTVAVSSSDFDELLLAVDTVLDGPGENQPVVPQGVER